MCSCRDADYAIRDLCNVQVTPGRLMEAWAALQPDVITLLTDELPAVVGNNRRAAAGRRSMRWLDACLRTAADTPELREASCLVRCIAVSATYLIWRTGCVRRLGHIIGVSRPNAFYGWLNLEPVHRQALKGAMTLQPACLLVLATKSLPCAMVKLTGNEVRGQVPVGGSAKLDDRKRWAAAVAERCADEVRSHALSCSRTFCAQAHGRTHGHSSVFMSSMSALLTFVILIASRDTTEIRHDINGAQARVLGFVIGGFGTGETADERRDMLSASLAPLPPAALRMAAGISTPHQVQSSVLSGARCLAIYAGREGPAVPQHQQVSWSGQGRGVKCLRVHDDIAWHCLRVAGVGCCGARHRPARHGVCNGDGRGRACPRLPTAPFRGAVAHSGIAFRCARRQTCRRTCRRCISAAAAAIRCGNRRRSRD